MTTGSCAARPARSAGTILEGDHVVHQGQGDRKYVEGGRHLVEIEQEARNQDDELSVLGTGIVPPSRLRRVPTTDWARPCRDAISRAAR